MNRNIYEKIILSIFAAYALLILVVRVAIVTSFLPETGGVSINMMYGIMHLSETGILYNNPESAPFAIIQYMPLHYYLVYWLGELFNVSHDVHSMLVLNRTLCLLSGIAYCVILSIAIIRLFPNAGKRIAASAGLLMFVLIPSHNYGRLDNLYLVFSLLALICFMIHVRRNERSSYKNVLLAGLFCSLAIFTKQTGIIAAGLFGLWIIFFERSFATFFRYALAVIIPTSIMIWFSIPSQPYDFKLNVLDGIKNGVDLNWFYQVIVKYYYAESGFFIAFGIYIAVSFLFEKKNNIQTFIATSILFFLGTAMMMSIKGGSNPFYYLEFTFMTIFGISLLIDRNPEFHKPYMRYVTLVIPFFLMSTINDKGWHEIPRMKKAKADYSECKKVADYINPKVKNNNFIYADFHMENCMNLLISKYALFACREVAFRFTRPQGVFHFNQFADLVKNGNVQYVIAKENKFPATVIDVELKSFVRDTSFGKYTVYRFEESASTEKH